MIESADLAFVDVTLTPLAVAPWNDTRQLFRPTARVGIREQRRPISTGRRARSIGVPSSVSRGALYLMLRNRTYRGDIVHNEQAHPGEHPRIIDQPLWDA